MLAGATGVSHAKLTGRRNKTPAVVALVGTTGMVPIVVVVMLTRGPGSPLYRRLPGPLAS
jgi:hypothetical protein